jgi:hypothetical protein
MTKVTITTKKGAFVYERGSAWFLDRKDAEESANLAVDYLVGKFKGVDENVTRDSFNVKYEGFGEEDCFAAVARPEDWVCSP